MSSDVAGSSVDCERLGLDPLGVVVERSASARRDVEPDPVRHVQPSLLAQHVDRVDQLEDAALAHQLVIEVECRARRRRLRPRRSPSLAPSARSTNQLVRPEQLVPGDAIATTVQLLHVPGLERVPHLRQPGAELRAQHAQVRLVAELGRPGPGRELDLLDPQLVRDLVGIRLRRRPPRTRTRAAAAGAA